MPFIKTNFQFIIFFAALTNFVCLAIVCYKCDSIALEACATSLNETELPYETCRSTLSCVMSIVDSVTYRGCGSSTPVIGATYTKTCTENLCNKGTYPPGRLKCYQCSGEACIDDPIGKPAPCRHHHEIDQCYTEVITADEAYRGCRSDTNRTVSGFAEYCEFNGCNNQAAKQTIKCAQCDSANSLGCKMDLFNIYERVCNITQYETCEASSLLSRQETCFVYRNLNRVVRGCTNQMPEDIRNDEAHTKECSDKHYCNAVCLTQQKCLVCNSVTNELCRSNSSAVTTSICGSAEASSCYTCEYNNWQVRRGCASPTPSSDTNRCYECDIAEGCNVTPFTRCYKCSTANNANCANWEKPGVVEIEECVQPGASCIIAALNSELTLRGCQSDSLHCNESIASCLTCEGNFCNKGAYPPKRIRCHQCTAPNECDVIVNEPMPCLLTELEPGNEREACFEYLHLQHGVQRGCRSNASTYYDCLFHNTDGCRLCFTDGCNDQKLSESIKYVAHYRSGSIRTSLTWSTSLFLILVYLRF